MELRDSNEGYLKVRNHGEGLLLVESGYYQEKALVGAFSVITNLRMELFEALVEPRSSAGTEGRPPMFSGLAAATLSAARS